MLHRLPRLTALAVLTTAAACALPATAGAAVSVGQSGWSWASPLPQGNTLRAIDFAGGRGYAAGDFGTLLRTDDGGASWSGLPTGQTVSLNRLQVLDADTVIVGGGCVLRRTDDAGKTFQRLPFGASETGCPAGVASFSFVSPKVGYVLLSDGTVLRTEDGGASFARRTAVPGTVAGGGQGSSSATSIAFTSDTVGIAVTAGAGPRILRTTDGGVSWTVVQAAPAALFGVVFTDADHGYAVGAGQTMLVTEDGGATWNARPLAVDAPPSTLTSIRCIDGKTCLISTAEGTRLLRTDDGGATARSITPASQAVFAAAFASATRAVGVGAAGTTVASDDAGLNYSPVGGALEGRFNSLRLSAGGVFALGANGALARSSDKGRTWTSGAVPTSGSVADVAFPTEKIGFALDSSGALQRTDNAGTSWRILDAGTESATELLAPSAESVLLMTRSTLRRSTDGGSSFSAVASKALKGARFSGLDAAGSAQVAYGSRTLAVTGNGGRSWAKIARPKKAAAIEQAEFVTARRGFLLLTDGSIRATADAGRTWRTLTGVGADSLARISFADARNGWAVPNDYDEGIARGWMLRTTDGGVTWRPQLISPDRFTMDSSARTLVATGADTAAALADGNSLFSATAGGDAGKATSLRLSADHSSVRKGRSVTVTGRLTGGTGGERALVWIRTAGARGAVRKVLRVATNGTFSFTRKLTAGTTFVAQVEGGAGERGAGSKALVVGMAKATR